MSTDNSCTRKRHDILRSSFAAIFRFRYARFHLVQMSHMSYSTRVCCHGKIFLFAPFRISCMLSFYFIYALTPLFTRCHEHDNSIHRLNWHNPLTHAILYSRRVLSVVYYAIICKTIRNDHSHQPNRSTM